MDARVKRYIVEDIIPHYIRADLDAIPHMTDEQKEAFLKLFEKMSYRNYAGKESFYRIFECMSVEPGTHIRSGSRLLIPSRYVSTTNDFNIVLKWIVRTSPKEIPIDLLDDNRFIGGIFASKKILLGSVICFINPNPSENIMRGDSISRHPKQPFVEDFKKEFLFIDKVSPNQIMGYGFFIRISRELFNEIMVDQRTNAL